MILITNYNFINQPNGHSTKNNKGISSLTPPVYATKETQKIMQSTPAGIFISPNPKNFRHFIVKFDLD